MSASNDTALALDALRRAVECRRVVPAGLVHHTNRGSPYASDDYRKALGTLGMTQSMSNQGDCWDNAVAESVFATLRAELVDHETCATAGATEVSIGSHIDRFYSHESLHSHLDDVSPLELELVVRPEVIAA